MLHNIIGQQIFFIFRYNVILQIRALGFTCTFKSLYTSHIYRTYADYIWCRRKTKVIFGAKHRPNYKNFVKKIIIIIIINDNKNKKEYILLKLKTHLHKWIYKVTYRFFYNIYIIYTPTRVIQSYIHTTKRFFPYTCTYIHIQIYLSMRTKF